MEMEEDNYSTLAVFAKVELRNNDKLLIGLISRSPSSRESNNVFLNGLISKVLCDTPNNGEMWPLLLLLD